MPVTIYRALAPGAVALAIAVGLMLNLLAPADVTIWFGVVTGVIAAAAAVTVGFHRHHTAVVVSLAASASSVASGHAGVATMGALAALAIFIALGDIHLLRMTDLRR